MNWKRVKDILNGISTMSVGTWVRTIAMLVSIVLTALELFGVHLVVAEGKIEEIAILAFAIITFISVWWKNNSVSKSAQAADGILEALREREGNTK